MNAALAAGAAGMAHQQAVLETIAANLANVDTPGYRAIRPEFASAMSDETPGLAIGLTDGRRLFTQGKLDPTSSDHDLAIDGAGFFQVVGADGGIAYTRAGNFSPDKNGRWRLPNGAALAGIVTPRGAASVSVAPTGAVWANVVGTPGAKVAGRIRLWSFADPALLSLGIDGLFHATPQSGQPQSAAPGTVGFGTIKQRVLERGNISIVAAMMAILSAQRAYEANSKTVQAADEMLRLANNLERG